MREADRGKVGGDGKNARVKALAVILTRERIYSPTTGKR